ncbi:MAG: glycosyltransferase [Synergistaceae bacterium]|nr:glycosyltransferase [Synergistaceae bacterium]
MSTYNGEKYLAEQLDSILAQECVHVELFVRDDGSTDSTKDILREYASSHKNIHLIFGENIGWRASFVTELGLASGYEFYSFSDQDDFWEKDKLSSAVMLIKQARQVKSKNFPILYYSNNNISDSKLRFIRKTKLDKRVRSLESVLIRMSVPGCFMVMNDKLRELIISRPATDEIFIRGHDTAAMILTYIFGGSVVFDTNAHMFYRQHENNTVGTPNGIISRIKKEFTDMLRYKGMEAVIAKAMLRAYGERITPQARDTLETVAGYREHMFSRLSIVFSPKFRTGDWRLTIFGKFKALLGLL